MDAAHIGVARYVVQVIKSKNAAGERLQETHPLGFALIFFAVFFDRERDVLRAQLFPRGKRAARAAPQLADNLTQMLLDDRLPEVFVREIIIAEKIVIKKM